MHIASLHVIAPERATSCTEYLQAIPPSGPVHAGGTGMARRRVYRGSISQVVGVIERARARGGSPGAQVPAPHSPSFIMQGGSAR